MAALRWASVVASDETGVRIEGANAFHRVFRCKRAVVHHAAPTRAASVVREMMGGHRPEVWLSDRYSAQQGHAVAQQTCLAHLAHWARNQALEADYAATQLYNQAQRMTPALVSGIPARDAALDRGYLSARLRAAFAADGCAVHTPPKLGMVDPPPWDRTIYARHHPVENLFSTKLKD